MKKLVLSISMFLIAATTFAQSEVVTDSIPPISLDGYKNFNGFMLDMGSMIMVLQPCIYPHVSGNGNLWIRNNVNASHLTKCNL